MLARVSKCNFFHNYVFLISLNGHNKHHSVSRQWVYSLWVNRQATISIGQEDRKWVGADLEPLGVSQRCQGQQTSVSIQHLPLLLLSLHSLRSSTQHCHKTITTQYRERKTHTRHVWVCVFEFCMCECMQTHLELCVNAHIHTHTLAWIFWYIQGAFHAIKLFLSL